MSDPLASCNEGPAKEAILEFVARSARRFQRSSASLSSTTTAPCGARSRCRSRSSASCAGWPRWLMLTRPCAIDSPGRNYIASGRDFMRPISEEVYGIPREGVIGSAVALAYTPDENDGAITRQAAADYLDDGPAKPVPIWNRTGRRPVLAAGNSNGDIEMLDFTQHSDKPYLRLLVLHDDADREFD